MRASPSSLDAHDLVLCSGTLRRGVPFAQRCGAAVAGGFAGISLWGRDVADALAGGSSLSDLRAMLDDHGLSVAEIDPAWWWPPGAAGIHIPPQHDPFDVFCFGERELFEMADQLGARSLNAVDVFGGDWTTEQAAASFAGLCDRAADHGLLVHLEFLPWSRFPDAASAWEVARLADRPNGGIAVDSWHFFRGSPDLAALRAIPGGRILGIQLSDAPATPEVDLLTATLHDRLAPGEGELDLASLVEALADAGAAAPLGAEVFSDELHAMAPADAARRVAAGIRALPAVAR